MLKKLKEISYDVIIQKLNFYIQKAIYSLENSIPSHELKIKLFGLLSTLCISSI